jgi:protein tyrosine phosphatase (PTP) superfamily phosphohydrolase (DUF442 family)
MKCVLTLLAASGLVFAGSDTPAIPNFHQVDEHLFRGAQPAASEFRDLARMGIKTVLDLREEGHAIAEEKLVEAAGMRYINLPMSGVLPPSDQQISRALAVMEDPAGGPVFVHCRRRPDRHSHRVLSDRARWLAEPAGAGRSPDLRHERA